MSTMNYEQESQIVGGRGYGFGGGSFLETLLALGLINNGGFGNNCNKPTATCEDVWKVDSDVKDAQNTIEHDICELSHDIDSKIDTVNQNMSNYAFATQAAINDVKVNQEKGFTEIAGLIKTTALEQEAKAAAAKVCDLEAKLNKYELIACLKEGK